MEKQIEEMACDKCLHYGACLFNSEYVPTPCHKYENNAGYRKASDVAEEIFAEIDILVDDWKHSRIQSIQFIAELAELKKKYTEDGKNERRKAD